MSYALKLNFSTISRAIARPLITASAKLIVESDWGRCEDKDENKDERKTRK